MANFITGTELSTAITAATYNGATDSGDATVLALILGMADARVLSALRRSGYPTITVANFATATSTADQYMIKAAAITAAVYAGYGRRGVAVPATFKPWITPEQLDSGEVRLPDTAPAYTSARGGIIISDSGTESDPTTDRGTTFGMDKTGGYP